MVIFYNVIGSAITIIAILAFNLSLSIGKDRQALRSAARLLTGIITLIGLSFFTIQFEPRIESGTFEKLNPMMMLFIFLIGQGYLYTVLILLHKSTYACGKYLKRSILPVAALATVYWGLHLIFGDVRIYSAGEFFELLPRTPMLMLRCILFSAIILSLLYGLIVCHTTVRTYNRQMADHFSTVDFRRSIWISSLLWSGQTLAVWALLTNLYTSPILEIVSCTLTAAVLGLQLHGFRNYIRYKTGENSAFTGKHHAAASDNRQQIDLEAKIAQWVMCDHKPFTKASLTIGDMANEIGVSKSKLSTYINSKNRNFCSWINEFRMAEAKKLLAEQRELSISDIAERTGFCDLPAFSRRFKKMTGVSPTTFRNRLYSHPSPDNA